MQPFDRSIGQWLLHEAFHLPHARRTRDIDLTQHSSNHIDAENIKSILHWCESNRIDCLYFLTEAEDLTSIRTAEDNKFRLVQIRVTLSKDLRNWENTNNRRKEHLQIATRPATRRDAQELSQIGKNIFTYARFYSDPCFPTEKSQQLYETWTRKSVEGYADQVIVLKSSNQILGFVTCRIDKNDKLGKIELIGLRSEAQGHNLGKELMQSALDWFSSQGLEKATITTQGQNIAMQRLAQRIGFETETIQLYHHKWFINCNQKA